MTEEDNRNKQKSVRFLLWVGILLIIALIVFFLVTVVFSDSSDSDTTDDVGDDTVEVEEIENSIELSVVEGVSAYTNF